MTFLIGRLPAAAGSQDSSVVAVRKCIQHNGGATAVEFAFVLPIIVVLITGIVQLGGLFFLQNNMVSVAQDSARRLATGEMTATQVQSFAQSQLINWGVVYTVTTGEVGDDASVTISVPLEQASLMDVLGLFQDGNLRAAAIFRRQN
jgi:Flp pilus assembly protein TadG